MSEAELLAIFSAPASPARARCELGRDLLARFGGLRHLFAAPLDEVSAVHGLGPAKYAQLQAVVEMARRALAEEIAERDAMTSPQAVRDYLALSLGSRPHEVFVAMFLDAQNRLLGSEELFRGTLTQTSVYPREVVKTALRHNAAGVIFAHNHPSGVAEPSRADELLTQTLKQALSLVEIKTLDHFIVAGRAYDLVCRAGLTLTPAGERCPSQRMRHLGPKRLNYLAFRVTIQDFRNFNELERAMARVCQVTGKAPMVGNNVSHANNKTKRRFLPNLQRRRFWVESENRWVSLRLTNAALRTIDKNGIDAVLADLRARGEHV